MNQASFADVKGNSFYIWGGHAPYGVGLNTVTKVGIWKFTADGSGGGSWQRQLPQNPDVFSQLTFSEDGAHATAGDTGFYIGGMASGWTEPGRAATQPVPGVVSFNMSTNTWTNTSVAPISPFGTVANGVAEFVPTFGANGLVLVLGGTTFTLKPDSRPPDGVRDLRNVTFFDPVSQQWYWQIATGAVPSARQNFCIVSARSQNNTYEMYVVFP
jgi:hypothetical protein